MAMAANTVEKNHMAKIYKMEFLWIIICHQDLTQKKSCSAEHFWHRYRYNWGVKKSKLLRMAWNTYWLWNFWNPTKLLKICKWSQANNPVTVRTYNHTNAQTPQWEDKIRFTHLFSNILIHFLLMHYHTYNSQLLEVNYYFRYFTSFMFHRIITLDKDSKFTICCATCEQRQPVISTAGQWRGNHQPYHCTNKLQDKTHDYVHMF